MKIFEFQFPMGVGFCYSQGHSVQGLWKTNCICPFFIFFWWHKVSKTFWRIKPKKGKTLIDGEAVQARKCKVLHIIYVRIFYWEEAVSSVYSMLFLFWSLMQLENCSLVSKWGFHQLCMRFWVGAWGVLDVFLPPDFLTKISMLKF